MGGSDFTSVDREIGLKINNSPDHENDFDKSIRYLADLFVEEVFCLLMA
jgi:hypothetical protein